MIAEDALDRYLVRFVERKTPNRYIRALVRGAANPSRSFANVIGFLGQAMGIYAAGQSAGFIGAVIGAIIVLAIYHMVRGRRRVL